MIPDVDTSLVALIERRAGLAAGTGVVVATPTAAWAAAVKRPAVDLWLYAVREDVEHRPAGWHDIRDESGRLTGRQAPLRRYRLSYAVSAWGASAAEEHDLLSRLLSCLAGADVFPAECLTGYLVEDRRRVALEVALPGDGGGLPWEAWGALGTEPRVTLDLVVSAPLPEPAVVDAGPPVQSRVITVAQPGGAPHRLETAAKDAVIRRRFAPPNGKQSR